MEKPSSGHVVRVCMYLSQCTVFAYRLMCDVCNRTSIYLICATNPGTPEIMARQISGFPAGKQHTSINQAGSIDSPSNLTTCAIHGMHVAVIITDGQLTLDDEDDSVEEIG
ncbi:hypothetical protein T12_4429 [Trichinella patagoniensis]|uniref:Uncharacterized protein n=1 Tax=Trichinella patagoniensis TaxID=990121 RepID=A0A0V0ZIF5_9BILA|nr:hypothetical protein T12_4429 [Trichinella patagoniensis]